ncbi:MAG: ATP-binding protein [Verrucomicrobiota bacterium]|nr:ATP-binding protein [Verrucomicrobiota bacterium]
MPDCERLAQDIGSAREKLHIVEQSGRQAAGIVKDLLTMSDPGMYEKKTVDLNRTVQSVLAAPDIAEMIRQRPDLRVETALLPSPAWISGSEPHLARALVNLLCNAIHAMDARKNRDASTEMRLTLRTSAAKVDQPIVGYEVIQPGAYVVLEVTDTGTGIEPPVMEKIFDPFFTTRSRGAQHGIGLGLPIVRRVVKDHGGFVDVRSTVNQGATFRLYLAAAGAPAVADRPRTAVHGETHILAVDDEAGARHVAEFLLQRLGFKVTPAKNGHEALKFFEDAKAQGVEKPCDVMMLDMVMEEGFDGLTTFEHIVKLYPAQKVIVASGYAPNGRAKVILDRGAGWLEKPCGIPELSAAIRKQLDKN